MKKILLFLCLIVLIPLFIVNVFIKQEEIMFEYISDMNIRVKIDDNSIINIPFEDYIVGVLAAEMPISFHEEAFKAQALAARSYAIDKMNKNKENSYDIINSTANQVYYSYTYLKEVWGKEYIKNINKLKKIVIKTKGEYLTYNDEVIQAFFFSTSPGKTEDCIDIFNSDVPYLKSVDSSWDNISPVYETKVVFDIDTFCNKLSIICSNSFKIKKIKETSTGRVKKISINNVVYDADYLKKILNLKSTYFTIISNEFEVIINVKGYGHGVGMSQYGAEAMSIKGYSYDDIVKYYYKNVEIKKI